jgi:hypothetical protein
MPAATREDNPLNLESRLARVCAGVHRLEGGLLIVLDINRVLDLGAGVIPHAGAIFAPAGRMEVQTQH